VGDGAVLLTRVHHAVGDGIALARVLLSATDDGDGGPGIGGDHHRGSALGAMLHAGVAAVAHPRRTATRGVTDLDAVVAKVPSDVSVTGLLLTGDPAKELAARSAELDLLVIGSRGYGPMHSVLVGGVSGRVMRSAECPVIVVPRGVEAPLAGMVAGSAATSVLGGAAG
jgi:nucleotide-binding universal stress UspA family protein